MKRSLKIGALWVTVWLIELAVFFIIAETISGLFLPPALRYYYPQPLLVPSLRRIYDFQPNQRTFTIDKPFVTNSMGFRDDREVPVNKRGEFRILSLGDSMAEGLGVSAEDTYASQLERLLGPRYGPIRVINAGVDCYSTWQEVDLLEEKGMKVQPDVVMLAFFWNDLYTRPLNVVPLSSTESGERRDAVWQYVRWLKRSRVLSYLRERFQILGFKIWPSFDWVHQEMIYEGRTNSYIEQAYNDVSASLEEFKALADIYGFKPILIIFPIPGQVRTPDAPSHMQRRIEAMARRADLQTVDLLSMMQRAYAVKPDLYIPWDNVHLSPRGHGVVAKALEQYLLENRLVVP
jgi:lysophospholipase L1-like esterase